MDGSDTLLTTAEIAVAIAGFSGVVVVLGRPSLSDWTPVDVLRLESLLGVSLGAVIFALLPVALHHLGLADTSAMGLSSAIMCAYICAMSLVFRRRTRGMSSESRRSMSRGLTRTLSVVWVVASLALAFNALAVVFRREFGIYYLCLIWFLVVACIQFGRIILVRFHVRE